MRLALRVLVGVGLLLAALSGSAAFNFAYTDARDVTVSIVADSVSYVALAANSASPHDCFVSESSTTGKLALSFGATGPTCDENGGGQGVNAGLGTDPAKFTRYAFHDILLVTNKGTRSSMVWVNATSTTGTLVVAKKATSGTMTDADYAATSATGLSLAVGSSAYVGVRVNTTTVSSGSISGTIRVDARGTG